MAVVGTAYVNIRAITDQVEDDIRRGLQRANRTIAREGERAGESYSRGLGKGFGRGGGRGLFSKRFQADIDAARNKLANLVAISNFLGPSILGVAGAIASLGAGLFALGSAVGSATPALIVLPGVLSAVAQAAVTLRLAFGGVAQAISAGLRSGGGGGAGRAADDLSRFADQIENAADRIAAARRKLTQTIRENVQRRLDAQEAARNAEELVEERLFALSRAQRDYADAQLGTKRALDELSRARKQAIEDLQQLRFEAEGAVLSEEKARLAFERSRDSLQRVQDLPPNSRARQEAELAFKEADLNLRRAIDRNNDLQKEERDATKAGVEGSRAVIDAQENLSNARRAEKDALRDIAQANKDVSAARRDAARAAREVGNIERENVERQKDAIQDLVDALKDYEDTRRKQFENERARSGGGRDPFAEAMKNLSKEAQDFVKYIISIQDEFRALRAAAGQELFPKLTVAIDNLVKNLFPVLKPLLVDTGAAIGDVAIKISETITEAENLRRLESIWKNNDYVIRQFGEAVSNLYTSLLILLDTAGPLIRRFTNWVVAVTEAWEATLLVKEGTGELTETFNKAGDVAAQLGRIFSNVFGGLGEMMSAATGPGSGGEFLLNFFENATAKFEAFREAGNRDGSLADYFREASINAASTLQLLNQIFQAFMRTASSDGVGLFVIALKEVVTNFEQIFMNFESSLPTFGLFLQKVSEIMLAFSDSEAVEMFFYMLNEIARAMESILKIPFVREFIAFAGPLFAIAAAFRLLIKLLAFTSKAFLGILALIPKLVLGMFGLEVQTKKTGFAAGLLPVAFKKAGTSGVIAINSIKGAFISTGIGAVIVGVTTLLGAFAMAQMNAKAAADSLTDSIDKQAGAFTEESIRLVTDALNDDVTQAKEWKFIYKALGISQREMAEAVLEGGAAYDEIQAKIVAFQKENIGMVNTTLFTDKWGVSAEEARSALSGLSSSLTNQQEVATVSREQLELYRIESDMVAEANSAAEKATGRVSIRLAEYADQQKWANRQAKEAAEAQEKLAGELKGVSDALSDYKDALDVSQAKDDFLKGLRDLDKKLEGTVGSFDKGEKGAKKARDAFREAASSVIEDVKAIGGSPEEQAANLETGLKKLRKKFRDNGFSKEDVNDFMKEFDLLPSQAAQILEDSATTAGDEAVAEWRQTGIDSVDGLVDGLTSPEAKRKVYAGVTQVTDWAQRAARNNLEIDSPSKVFARFGKFVVQGLSKGIEDTGQEAVDSINKVLDKMIEDGDDKTKEFADSVKGRLEVFMGDLKQIATTAKDFTDTLKNALEPPDIDPGEITDPLAFAEFALDRAAQAAEVFNNKLAGGVGGDRKRSRLIADLENIATVLQEDLLLALDAAETQLAELQTAASNFADSVRSAITGGVDIQDAAQRAKEEGKSIQQVLDEQLGKTRTFVSKVNELIGAGYSVDTIQSVISLGVQGGTELAQAILDGGTAVLQADQSIAAELDSLAQSLIDSGNARFFNSGIAAAEENLKGVRDSITAAMGPQSTVMQTMDAFAKALGRDVVIKVRLNKKKFNVTINVKRIIRDTDFAGGAFEAAGATGAIVNRPTIALIGEAGPEAVVPLNKTKGNGPLPTGGMGGVTVNVYPSAGMNEEELANMVSRKLAFEMRRGAV